MVSAECHSNFPHSFLCLNVFQWNNWNLSFRILSVDFFFAFFIVRSYCSWWWNTIIRFKGRFWGSCSGNAVLDAVTNFIVPDKLRLTTTWSRLHVPEQASSLDIFRQSLFSHWFLSCYYLHQPTEALSLSFSLPFSSFPLYVSSLSSRALWLQLCPGSPPCMLSFLCLLPLVPLDLPDE